MDQKEQLALASNTASLHPFLELWLLPSKYNISNRKALRNKMFFIKVKTALPKSLKNESITLCLQATTFVIALFHQLSTLLESISDIHGQFVAHIDPLKYSVVFFTHFSSTWLKQSIEVIFNFIHFIPKSKVNGKSLVLHILKAKKLSNPVTGMVFAMFLQCSVPMIILNFLLRKKESDAWPQHDELEPNLKKILNRNGILDLEAIVMQFHQPI